MTEIPLEHFCIFSSGVYDRLKYFLSNKNKERSIIGSGKKGWNTFVHLIQWGMAGKHNIKTGKKSKIHGYKNKDGSVWKYSEYHVELILFVFKELGIVDFYYLDKESKLPRKNLNDFSKEKDLGKIALYERTFRLKQLNEIELEYEMKKYLSNSATTTNPKGLLA